MRLLPAILLLFLAAQANAQMALPAGQGQAYPQAPLATNLVNHTNSIGGTNWTFFTASATLNNSQAPDGTTTASLITNSGTGSCAAQQSVTVSASTNYTVSVYVKQGTAAYADVSMSDYTANAFGTEFHFSDQTFTDTSAGTCSSPAGKHGYLTCNGTNCPVGWYRVWVTSSCSASVGAEKFAVGGHSATTGACVNGQTINAWGAQLQSGTSLTTYVPN